MTTKKSSIAEMNEVIARFMGGKRILHPSQKHFSEDHFGYVCHDGRWWNENNLKYHTSWDWLRRVWIKFRDLKFTEETSMKLHLNYISRLAQDIAYGTIEEFHHNLHIAITWFNQQPKTNDKETTGNI